MSSSPSRIAWGNPDLSIVSLDRSDSSDCLMSELDRAVGRASELPLNVRPLSVEPISARRRMAMISSRARVVPVNSKTLLPHEGTQERRGLDDLAEEIVRLDIEFDAPTASHRQRPQTSMGILVRNHTDSREALDSGYRSAQSRTTSSAGTSPKRPTRGSLSSISNEDLFHGLSKGRKTPYQERVQSANSESIHEHPEAPANFEPYHNLDLHQFAINQFEAVSGLTPPVLRRATTSLQDCATPETDRKVISATSAIRELDACQTHVELAAQVEKAEKRASKVDSAAQRAFLFEQIRKSSSDAVLGLRVTDNPREEQRLFKGIAQRRIKKALKSIMDFAKKSKELSDRTYIVVGDATTDRVKNSNISLKTFNERGYLPGVNFTGEFNYVGANKLESYNLSEMQMDLSLKEIIKQAMVLSIYNHLQSHASDILEELKKLEKLKKYDYESNTLVELLADLKKNNCEISIGGFDITLDHIQALLPDAEFNSSTKVSEVIKNLKEYEKNVLSEKELAELSDEYKLKVGDYIELKSKNDLAGYFLEVKSSDPSEVELVLFKDIKEDRTVVPLKTKQQSRRAERERHQALSAREYPGHIRPVLSRRDTIAKLVTPTASPAQPNPVVKFKDSDLEYSHA